MDQYITANALSEINRRDPRSLRLELMNRGIAPDAELKSERRNQKLYSVDKIRALAADILLEAKKRG